MKTLLASLVLYMSSLSCAAVTVDSSATPADLRCGGYVVEFEFDRIHLADTIKSELMKQGYTIADAREHARFLWTGAYSSSFDVTHDRFDWAQFKIVDLTTNKTASLLQVGQGGLVSVEGVIREMIRRLDGEKPPKQQRPD